MRSLYRLEVAGFRSLANVSVPLGRLTVLVGPNGSGKSNVLRVLRLLAATVRFDLSTAVADAGGFSHILRADGESQAVRISVEAAITEHASVSAPDEYTLDVSELSPGVLRRGELLVFKRTKGRGRRFTVQGSTITAGKRTVELSNEESTGLSTLPKLALGDDGPRQFASFLSTMRVLEPAVELARDPARHYGAPLSEDASNLADALLGLRERNAQAFADLQRDVRRCLPGLRRIDFATRGGASRTVVVELHESGLSRPIELSDASFGTVRLLALLTALYEPEPPELTAIEEIDHGLHPYALDVVADALRSASERTQLLVATHSPTFVNRLRPHEVVICDRNPEDGSSIIPATSSSMLDEASQHSGLQLGEMWYAGAVGGVPT